MAKFKNVNTCGWGPGSRSSKEKLIKTNQSGKMHIKKLFHKLYNVALLHGSNLFSVINLGSFKSTQNWFATAHYVKPFIW
jgi:hypothetical protein